MTDPQDIEDNNNRSFSHWLTTLENGVLHADLSKAVEDIVADLHDLRERGMGEPEATMTLNIKFKLEKRMVIVTPKYTTRLPEIARDKSYYYVTPENRLSRQDPQQRAFAFRDVNAEERDVRNA